MTSVGLQRLGCSATFAPTLANVRVRPTTGELTPPRRTNAAHDDAATSLG
jgi:hypothetical protein